MIRVLKAYRPRDLRCPPADLFVSEEQRTFQDYTGLRCWLEEWLGYYQWWLRYYQIANNYLDYRNPTIKKVIDRVTIDDVFSPPVSSTSWKISNKDPIRVRFSLLMKIKSELDNLPPILEIEWTRESDCYFSVDTFWCHSSNNSHFVYSEGLHSFMVVSKGLIIPWVVKCPGCLARKRVTQSVYS